MLKWIMAVVLIVAGLSIQACAPKSQDDCGFVQNAFGERISWKGSIPVTMYVHSSVPPEYFAAIQSAADVWEKQAGRKLFEIVTQPLTGPINPIKDGSNVIYLMKNWESDRSSEQARTSIYWVGDQIKEADIRINAQFNFYFNQKTATSNSVNIEALLIHEMGHVLGLKHKDQGGSVMATYLPSGSDRVHLAETDGSSLQCEY